MLLIRYLVLYHRDELNLRRSVICVYLQKHSSKHIIGVLSSERRKD